MDGKKPISLSTTSREFKKANLNTSSRVFRPGGAAKPAPVAQPPPPQNLPQTQPASYFPPPPQGFQNPPPGAVHAHQNFIQPVPPPPAQTNTWPQHNLAQSTPMPPHQTPQYPPTHHTQYQQPHHRPYHKKDHTHTPLPLSTIHTSITQKLTSSHLTLTHSQNPPRKHYTLTNPKTPLKPLLPDPKTPDSIFTLYFTLPIEEEKQRKLEEEKEKLRKEEEEKQKQIARAELLKEGVNPNMIRKERVFSSEEELEGALEGYSASDKNYIKDIIKRLKEGKNLSIAQFKEFRSMPVCQEANGLCLREELLTENREPIILDSYGGNRRKGGYNNRRGGGGYRDRDRDRERDRDRGYNKRNYGEGGFQRKELSKEQKIMKDQAANLKKTMAERNNLVSEVELKVKLLMNKITPENEKSVKKQIEKIMVENEYKEDVLASIGLTIFKKACIEKKYTSMYSDLCSHLTKLECKAILKRVEEEIKASGDKSGNIEEQKKEHEAKLADLQKQLKEGKISEIPANMKKKFKPKKAKAKSYKSYKKESHIRNSIINQCRMHVEELADQMTFPESDPDWEDKLQKYRSKIFGNIKFVGELFNKDFLTSKLLLGVFENSLLKIPKDLVRENTVMTPVANDMIEACCILCEATGEAMERQWDGEDEDEKSGKKLEQIKEYKQGWEDILATLVKISKLEDLVDSRIRILIKNTFSSKEAGWNKDKDEGPLKLKELHKRVRREQTYGYEEEYEKTKAKPKKDDRKQKHGGGNYFGMAEFAEIEAEEEKIDTHQASADERFKDIDDEKLSDICIGNFKEYLDHEEFAFESFEAGLKAGVSKGYLVFGLFYKLFDNPETVVERFDEYLMEAIKQLNIKSSDITEGLTKYNAELVNLECDYPFVDRQYSKILYVLAEENLVDFEKIKWYSPEDEMSDIFFKIFIRLAEKKFIESDHEKDELIKFIKENKIKEILESIKKFLLEENLIEEYHSTIKDEPLSESLKDLEVCAHTFIYSELGLN